MAVQKWTGLGTAVTVMSSELASLANGAIAEVALDNTSGLNIYGVFELVFSAGTAPTADSTCDLYRRLAPDGTNYEDGSASRPPANGALGSFVADNNTGPQRHVIADVVLFPGLQKIMLKNNLGYAFSGTCTLKFWPYNQQVS
jgi:hypothetical protein